MAENENQTPKTESLGEKQPLTKAERKAKRLEEKTAKLVNSNIEAYVALHNVNKVYPDGIHAVHDFNIDIKKHEFIVLVGPSGCGKSTTLRMIAGLEGITSGDLYIDKVYSNNLESRDRNIAMVFQNYALYPNMTVYDNIAFGMKMRGVDKATIDEKVRYAAKMLQLDDYLFKKPSQLSGGQKQRVALGRAIVRDAKLFLMDEPLSNLDAKLRVQTRAEIVRLHEQLGATTIYVTHDQTEAMTMATRIVCMSRGHVQQIGTPLYIYEHPANKFVATFIGSPSMNILKAHYNHGHVTVGDKFAYDLTAEEKKKVEDFYKYMIIGLNSKIAKLDEAVSMLPHRIDPIEKRDEDLSQKREKTLNKRIAEYYKAKLKSGGESLSGDDKNELQHKIDVSLAIAREALYHVDAEKITGVSNLPGDSSVEPDIYDMAKKLDAEIEQERHDSQQETYTRYLEQLAKIDYSDRIAKAKVDSKKAAEIDAAQETVDINRNEVFLIKLEGHKAEEFPTLQAKLAKLDRTQHLNARQYQSLFKAIAKDLRQRDLDSVAARVPELIAKAEKEGEKKTVALTEEERSRALSNSIVAKAVTRGTMSTLKFYQRFSYASSGHNLKSRDQLKAELLEKYTNQIATYKKYLETEDFDLSFGIRPESMTIARLASNYARPSQVLTVDVNVAELLGSEYYLHSSYDGIDFVAKVPLDSVIKDHAPCDLVLNLDSAHLFDDVSDNCIF